MARRTLVRHRTAHGLEHAVIPTLGQPLRRLEPCVRTRCVGPSACGPSHAPPLPPRAHTNHRQAFRCHANKKCDASNRRTLPQTHRSSTAQDHVLHARHSALENSARPLRNATIREPLAALSTCSGSLYAGLTICEGIRARNLTARRCGASHFRFFVQKVLILRQPRAAARRVCFC